MIPLKQKRKWTLIFFVEIVVDVIMELKNMDNMELYNMNNKNLIKNQE
jgi:hypothetical protein